MYLTFRTTSFATGYGGISRPVEEGEDEGDEEEEGDGEGEEPPAGGEG